MSSLRTFASFLAVALLTGAAAGQTLYGDNPFPGGAIPIPDGTTPEVCVTPILPTITVPAGAGTIEDINVHLNLTHTWIGDLNISVTHPDGTTVILTNGTPDDSSNLAGTYVFDDEAATTFDAAMSAAGVTIPVGSYRGDGPLCAFEGRTAVGTWTISICDTFGADIGTLNGAQLEVTAAQSTAGENPFSGGPVPIPDGTTPEVCVTPVLTSIVVAGPGSIQDVNVHLNLTHTWVGDLNMEIMGPDGTTVILTNGTPDDSSNLAGTYVMDDEAPTTFDAAMSAAGTTVPVGSYRPDGLLSAFDGKNKAGAWTISVCDTFGADIGTVVGALLEFVSDDVGVEYYGGGCTGTGGLTPQISGVCGSPKIGENFGVSILTGLAGSAAFAHLSTVADVPGTPFFGCPVHLGFPAFAVGTVPSLDATGSGLILYSVPADLSLVGGVFNWQWAALDAGSGNGVFTLSRAMKTTVQP